MKQIDDRALPGMATALDVERVAELLRAALPVSRDGLALERVKIYDVQYRPGTNCELLYSVKFRSAETGRSEKQLLSGMVYPEGKGPITPTDDLVARYRRIGDHPFRDPVVHLPDVGLVAYAFPFDPRVPSLMDACDPTTMKLKLSRMWKKRGVRVRRVSVEPLGYTPGARAALRYDTLGECRVTDMPEMRQLVGKIDARRDAGDLFSRSWAVWKESANKLRVAPPVGFVSDLRLFLQEKIEGRRLGDLAGTGDFVSPIRHTAKAAALLHRMELPLLLRKPFAQKSKAVRRWGDMLAAIRPQERSRLRELGKRLAAELELRASVTGAVHGDLHPSNVLVRNGRVTLIDLDNMTLGDCLVDVGRFLSSLRTSSLRVCGTANGLAEAGGAFLEHYLSLTGEDERRVRLFEAASLLITAGTGFRLQRPGWEETAAVLIDESERVFGLANAPSSSVAVPAPAEPRDSHHERWALDPQYIRGVLDEHIRGVYDADPTDCVVDRRRDTAKREKLRYRISGWRRDEPWKVSLEGILWHRRSGRRVTRRITELYRALEGKRDAPLIPRPVAYIREIGLQVLEAPRGTPLSSILTGPRAVAAIERLARALAVLHATAVPIDRSRTVREELDSLRSRFGRLRDSGKLQPSSEKLQQRVEEAIARHPGETGPVVRHLSLRRVLLVGERIGLGEVEDVVLSDPCLDAADVLGRLTLTGLENGDAGVISDLADRFRAAYLGNDRGRAGRLAAFEAAALLRLGYGEVDKAPAVVKPLFRAAEDRLERAEMENAR